METEDLEVEGTKEEESVEDSDSSSASLVEVLVISLETVLPRELLRVLHHTVKVLHHMLPINLKDMLKDMLLEQ